MNRKLRFEIKCYNAKVKLKIAFYKFIRRFFNKKLIIDITGTLLTPGCGGMGCKGNGDYINIFGTPVECCCNGCNYMMCCLDEHDEYECRECPKKHCPRSV